MLIGATFGKMNLDVSWLVAVGVFLVALAVGYTVLSSEIGHQAAARRFFGRVLVLLAVVLLGFAVFLTFPASAKGETWSTLLLLLSAVCWGSLLYRQQRKRQAGNLLLDLGRLPRQRLFILGGGLIAWAGLLDIARPRAAPWNDQWT
jgi:Ca2+/Na+ antiporter